MISILIESARASVRFALRCLEPYRGRLRPISSFVTPQAEVMHWHNFGDLIGPGWAANALGGANLLYRWGGYVGDSTIQSQALALLDYLLEDGYLRADGFIWPYYDLSKDQFCLNYVRGSDWLCPGSLAKIGVQLLEFAADLPGSVRAARMRQAALSLGLWLHAHTPLLPSGWAPRRIDPAGGAYPLNPHGDSDIIFDHSADGLYLLQLYAALAGSPGADFAASARGLEMPSPLPAAFGAALTTTPMMITNAWRMQWLSASCARRAGSSASRNGAPSPARLPCRGWSASACSKTATAWQPAACFGWRTAGIPPTCGRTPRLPRLTWKPGRTPGMYLPPNRG